MQIHSVGIDLGKTTFHAPRRLRGCRACGTRGASPWGTAGFVPREWLAGGPVSFAQDYFALGVTLHQLFTNAVPSASEPMPDIDTCRAGLPPVVGRLIAALTRDAAEDRITAAHARQELEAFCSA